MIRQRSPGADLRPRLGFFLALFAFLLFFEPRGSWLCDPDESRYAEISREMLAARDYLTLRLNGSRYFEKPPLSYWAGALSQAALGETPFAARLPARLAALGTAGLLAFGLESPAALSWGPWAALLLLSAPLPFALGRFNLTDGILTFALTAAFLALRGFLRAREERRPSRPWAMALGAAVALAVLAKGLIGIVFPGAVLLLWSGLLRRWKGLAECLLSPAPLVFLLVAAPWFLLIERANPGFSKFFFIHEHFQRFATSEAHRNGPFYFLPIVFLLGFLPWAAPFLQSLGPLLTFDKKALNARADELFFALWALVVVLFFSLSKSKLIPYVLPAFPAAAALAARRVASIAEDAPPSQKRWFFIHALFWTAAAAGGWVFAWRRGELARYGLAGLALAGTTLLLAGCWSGWKLSHRPGRRPWFAVTGGLAGLYLCMALAYPRMAGDLSAHALAKRAKELKGATVAGYRALSYNLPWELRRPIPVVGYRDELASDGGLDAALFWGDDDFWRRWSSKERLAVLVRRQDIGDFARPGKPSFHLAAENRNFCLLEN